MIGNIISSIILGAILGALARLILPGKQNISVVVTILAGMVAAFVGTLIARLFGYDDTRGIDWWKLITQIVLALIAVTLAARYFPGRDKAHSTPGGPVAR